MAGLSAAAAEEMKRVSSEVWFAYLERFTLPEACGHGGIRVREDFRYTNAAIEPALVSLILCSTCTKVSAV